MANEIERLDIRLINPSPSVMAQKWKIRRDRVIADEVAMVVEKAVLKSDSAGTPRTRVSALTQILPKLLDYQRQCADSDIMEPIIADMKRRIHRTQFSVFIDAAKKAEFKNQKKKALDQYQEALYFLKTDAVPDEQQSEIIKRLESKIEELQSG